MGQTADQLRQEVEQKREDAAAKIDAIEDRVQAAGQMARDTVDETVQKARETVTETVDTVKQSLHIRRQAEERLVLGGILSGMSGGADDRPRDGQHAARHQGGLGSGIRSAGKSIGLDDTLFAVSGALMGEAQRAHPAGRRRRFPGACRQDAAARGAGTQTAQGDQAGSPALADGIGRSSYATGRDGETGFHG